MIPSLQEMLQNLASRYPSGTGAISAQDAIAILDPIIRQSWLYTKFSAADLPADKQQYAGLTLPEILSRLILDVSPNVRLPVIVGFSPASGPTNTPVTIKGSNFEEAQGTVSFNGVQAVIQYWSPTRVIALVPAGESTGSVIIITALGIPVVANGIFTNKQITYTAQLQSYTTTEDDYTEVCGDGTGVAVTRTSSKGTSTESQEAANRLALADARQSARQAIVCGVVIPGNPPLAGDSVMKANIPVSLLPDETLGKYHNGETIMCKGWSFERTIRDIATRTLYPSYTPAVIQLFSETTSLGEIGASITVLVSANFTQNDAGTLQQISMLKNQLELGKSVTLPFGISDTFIRTAANISYNAKASYGRGVVKKTTPGNAPDDRGYAVRTTDHPQDAELNFQSNAFVVESIYPWFYGSSQSNEVPDIYGGVKQIARSNGQLVVPSFGAGAGYLWFAVPRDANGNPQKVFSTWYRTALDAGAVGGSTNLFASALLVQVTSVALAQNWTHGYDLYFSNYKTNADAVTSLN